MSRCKEAPMLKNYNDHPTVLSSVTGETIRGVFVKEDGTILLILSGGDALAFSGEATYWKEGREDVERIIRTRQAQVERLLAELKNLVVVEPCLTGS